MSEFLKFSFEMISQVIYNFAIWVASFFGNLIKLVNIFAYKSICDAYFPQMTLIPMILSVILCILLIAIPVGLVVLLVREIILRFRLKATTEDNVTLYKEIGRLNKQVMELMDEKNMILALKTGVGDRNYIGLDYKEDGTPIFAENGMSAGPTVLPAPGAGGVAAGVASGAVANPAMADPLADPLMAPVGAVGGVAFAGGVGGNVTMNGDIGEDALSSAAAAAAVAAAQAKSKADEQERNAANRFPKLQLVDAKYENLELADPDTTISLEDFVNGFRNFACSQMHLYYTPEIVRRFVAGMAASKVMILEGISGTGKTSLPYSFSRYMDYPATIVSVQPSFRDRTELLGYFNEFSKRFNETEFLRALYEAGYRQEPALIVLDEMNLARIEYYFAEMLSVLEMPNQDEWVLDLVPTAWAGDPVRMSGGKINVSPNTWFVGTANNDDSTFTITDKVYDRAMPIELNERADAFECELTPRCCISYEHLVELFNKAKADHPISEATLTKMNKLNQYLQTRFKLAFGNRIVKQMYDFIPVYVACGGSEIDGLDYIIARKVLKKFESQNVAFVRDEMKGLLEYLDKTFGENNMNDSRSYLQRIQNLY